jgi:hypothetical protein
MPLNSTEWGPSAGDGCGAWAAPFEAGKWHPLQSHGVRTDCPAGRRRDRPWRAVVDEAAGQFQQEVALHAGPGAFDVESVVEEAVEDGCADGLVVIGLRGHVQGPGAEIPPARAAGAVFGVMDVEASLLAVSQRADTTAEMAFAPAALAAGRARVGLGRTTDDADARREHGLCPCGERR